jgi:fatty-acyl-CoA synthase
MVCLSASVAYHARITPHRDALLYGRQRLSYAQLLVRVETVGGLLQRRGVRPGQVVALLMKNSAAFIELSLAISHVGAVLLPINYRLGAEEVAYIL